MGALHIDSGPERVSYRGAALHQRQEEQDELLHHAASYCRSFRGPRAGVRRHRPKAYNSVARRGIYVQIRKISAGGGDVRVNLRAGRTEHRPL